MIITRIAISIAACFTARASAVSFTRRLATRARIIRIAYPTAAPSAITGAVFIISVTAPSAIAGAFIVL